MLQIVRGGAVSAAEFRLHALLAGAGLTAWTAGAEISDANGVIGVADLLFAAARVIIEVDGWRAHSSQSTFINDRRRQNRLLMAGYLVLRFTWQDLTDRPNAVLAEIRTALLRGSAT